MTDRPQGTAASPLAAATPETRLFVRTRTGYLDLPVRALDPDSLFYRTDNGRILLEIREYCRDHAIAVEDLKALEATAPIQAALHDLLMDKASDETASILAELERHAVQTEPLLITADGVVVNGNRRLASMRALHRRDPTRYAAFAQVLAAVLPAGTTTTDIEFIEADLQMAPDLKLGYGWVNRRLKLRDHARDLPRELVVDAYRLQDAGAIDRELAELELAERYLDYAGKPGAYGEVADAEDRFVALHQILSEQKNERLRALWTVVGFAMILAEAVLDRPIDHYYPFTSPVPPAVPQWVMRGLAADRGLVEQQPPGLNNPLTGKVADRLLPMVSNPGDAEVIARHILALTDTLKANQTELLGAARVLSQLRKFRQVLEESGPSVVEPRQLRQIHAELAAVLDLLDEDRRPRHPANPMGLLRRLVR
ncbi:MAG: hypothetical protein H6843_07545 [Rhodospirillaceae bacterium]|nr:hypothetical protein [Rhodospirillaceae bacterium]